MTFRIRDALAISIFAGAVCLAWPFLSFRTYPHVPGSVYPAMVMMIVARALVAK
jgi:hypothetical protein